jgi:hypothetical protein
MGESMFLLRNVLALSLFLGVALYNIGCTEHSLRDSAATAQNLDTIPSPVVAQPPAENPPVPPAPPNPVVGCYPAPPPVHHLKFHVYHHPRPGKAVLDTTPIVCSDRNPDSPYYQYCQKVMNDPTRGCCPVRPEGDPMRMQCEAIIMGVNPKTERIGPSYFNEGPGTFQEHPDNQYLGFYFGNGRITACTNRSPAQCTVLDVTDNEAP